MATRNPLNATGDFFVECDTCTGCDAPRGEAPELIEYDTLGRCYFKRQPQTPDEIEHAISAVRVSCVEAVRYGGHDPDILARIKLKPSSPANSRPQSFLERFGDKTLNILRTVLNR